MVFAFIQIETAGTNGTALYIDPIAGTLGPTAIRITIDGRTETLFVSGVVGSVSDIL